MVFIDYENFNMARQQYYFADAKKNGTNYYLPRLDLTILPKVLVESLSQNHLLIKTFLFAPKPDDFLMLDAGRKKTYDWLCGMKNKDFFTVVEGRHVSRPAKNTLPGDMDINDRASYYVEEKGTDANITAHLITKAFLNAYDTAVILSGDTDYLPTLDILNTMGKTVIMTGVKGQNLGAFREHSDKQIILDDCFFKKCELKGRQQSQPAPHGMS
jgi:uncharacterized LabA/DUF88 family protein